MNQVVRGSRMTIHDSPFLALVIHLTRIPLWRPWLTCLSSLWMLLLLCNVSPLSLPVVAPVNCHIIQESFLLRGGSSGKGLLHMDVPDCQLIHPLPGVLFIFLFYFIFFL